MEKHKKLKCQVVSRLTSCRDALLRLFNEQKATKRERLMCANQTQSNLFTIA